MAEAKEAKKYGEGQSAESRESKDADRLPGVAMGSTFGF
jgi:hypothetical protein